ncbi:malate dehydrogenase, NAD-dependent [Dichotomocladium elegans]|nr:malate dehydrogenase, NAD-dependent [Dichotomocladium elegans]
MVKVCVCGAAGGIGQPLSLLLKQSHLITHLALYDIVNTPGVAADLSHINTKSKVTGHKGPSELEKAITGSDVVVIPAGVPRKPGMSRDDLFKVNAGIVRGLAVAAAQFAPKAFICVISNPVNSTVPVVVEAFKKQGVYDPKRIFGVTTLDIVRASTFVSELIGAEAASLNVPVVGGHSGVTILPLLSQVAGTGRLSQEQITEVTRRIQFGGDEIVKAKEGAGSATLSMAYAGARFVLNMMEAAFNGAKDITECTFINLDADPDAARSVKDATGENLGYFSLPVSFGPEGIRKVHPIGPTNEFEQKLLAACVPELTASIIKGVEYQ